MPNSLRSPPSSLLVCGNFFVVFLPSWGNFVTVSAGTEYNKEGQVVVWHWLYRGSSYAVWNCKSRSVVKLLLL